MDCSIQRERQRERGWRTHGKQKRCQGRSAIDESLKEGSQPGMRRDGRKRDIRRERQGEKQEGEKKPSVCKGWSPLKVSVAEEQCGKCDHSFNLKLSGVNKECVAGRRRGQDY